MIFYKINCKFVENVFQKYENPILTCNLILISDESTQNVNASFLFLNKTLMLNKKILNKKLFSISVVTKFCNIFFL